MNTLALELLDGSSVQRIEGILSLVAEDASGQLGIWPRHEALVTALAPGLVRYRCDAGTWQYLACAGGTLVCRQDLIRIVSTRFIAASDDAQLPQALDQVRRSERESRAVAHATSAEMERTLMKRLRELSEASRP